MKVLFEKLGFEYLKSVNISVALLIAILIFLTPIFTGVNGFVQESWANTRRIDEIEHRIQKIDMLDEKMNLLMIEIGISKYQIKVIEDHYIKKGE